MGVSRWVSVILATAESMGTPIRGGTRRWLAGFLVALITSACAGRHPRPVPVPVPVPVEPPPTVPEPARPPTPNPTPTPAPPAPIPPPATAASTVSGQDGYATYVAHSFHGRTGANGEPFNEHKLVAAHRTLPFGTVVRVTNVKNGRSVAVRIVDRGPYGRNYREGTIIDLSRAAARRLRMIHDGQVPARVEVLKLAEAK
jgi:rare lipoprotein A